MLFGNIEGAKICLVAIYYWNYLKHASRIADTTFKNVIGPET